MTTAVDHITTEQTPEATLPAGTPRVLFACGGTGGHVYPAIAIADAIRAEHPAAAIAFAGTRDRMEWSAVPKAGYPIHAVTVSGFQRGISVDALVRNVTFPIKLAKGLWDSLRLVRSFDPDIVVGTGGYVSGPVGMAGSMKGRKLVLQEQNAYAGATNKMLSKRADTIFIAFDAANEFFPQNKCKLAGNPVRQDLANADRAEALAHFGILEDATVLLVMGGSLGAGPLNNTIRRNIDLLLDDSNTVVIWQTGERYFEKLETSIPVHPRLRIVPYLDRMDLAYAAADLALCRSGAITCSELAVTGTPSVLVPSPNVTADHQTKNAKALEDKGAAVLLPETDLDSQFENIVLSLIIDVDRRASMREAALAMARPDAARTIAEHVVALAETKGGKT